VIGGPVVRTAAVVGTAAVVAHGHERRSDRRDDRRDDRQDRRDDRHDRRWRARPPGVTASTSLLHRWEDLEVGVQMWLHEHAQVRKCAPRSGVSGRDHSSVSDHGLLGRRSDCARGQPWRWSEVADYPATNRWLGQQHSAPGLLRIGSRSRPSAIRVLREQINALEDRRWRSSLEVAHSKGHL